MYTYSLVSLLALAGQPTATTVATPPAAQTAPKQQVERLIVTATRTPQPLDRTLAEAILITREDIESAGPATLAELLQRKAGLEIRATGGAGQPASVLIRGGSATHTLVLVDGLRIGSSTSGSAAIENIPLDLIERIEIVKGPMSGLYGSDALGGVVQIFTRGANRPRLTASAGFGTDQAAAANAGFSVSEGRFGITLDAGHRQVKPASATNPRASFVYHPDRDPYRETHGLVKLSHTLWQGEVVTLSAWQSTARAEFDAGLDDPGARTDRTLSGYQLTSENAFTRDWKSRLALGSTTDDSDTRSAFGGRFRTRQQQAVWFNEFPTASGHMSAGAEWRREEVESTVPFGAKTRETTSVFAGYLERLGDTQLEFSLRRDEEDQFGARNTGTIAYGYPLRPGVSVHLRVGNAFRAPSFNDLYYPDFSNPALRPEKSEQAEMGIRWAQGPGRLHLTHFENRIDDLIIFDTATFLPQNVARARIKGWEVTAETKVAGFDVRAALTVQKPQDRDTGRQLRSRAKEFGSISATRAFGKWTVGLDAAGSGHRFDSANEAPASRMGGYGVLNAQVGYQVDKRWRIEVSARNLADRKYELAQGYDVPGRSINVTVRALAF